MPPKRAARGEDAKQAKKLRKAIDEMAEELVCPITQELAVDPVTAEDGRVYERSAIEDWLEQTGGAQVKSPVTNELMGKKLLTALQVRNNIKSMVESGAISGETADAWARKKAVEDEKRRVKAEAAEVTRLDSMRAQPGEVWFLLDSEWLTRWREYAITKTSSEPPGPVSNWRLLALGRPKPDLLKRRDYRGVNEQVWMVFMRGCAETRAFASRRQVHAFHRFPDPVCAAQVRRRPTDLPIRDQYVRSCGGAAPARARRGLPSHPSVGMG